MSGQESRTHLKSNVEPLLTSNVNFTSSLAKLSRTKFNLREPSKSAIPSIITKSLLRVNPLHLVNSELSKDVDGSKEVILNVVEPVYTDSQYNLHSLMTMDKLELFFEESVREILSHAAEDSGENLVREFMSNFLDGSEGSEQEVSRMTNCLLTMPRLWSESEYSKIISTQKELYQQVSDDVASNAIADILQETLMDTANQSSAKKELSNIKKQLKKLYYTKSCLMCRLPPKRLMMQALEDTDREVLYVKGTNIEKLTDHDVLSIVIALKCGLKLKELVLRNHDITDFGMWHLCYALKSTNWFLVTLDLSYNNIDEKGAEALAEILKANINLKTLVLRGNKIKDSGNLSIARALELNFHLISLDLADTDAETKSTVALFVVISTHCCLRCVKLGRPLICNQQEDSLHHLARAFQVNRVLEEIHLPKFGITDKGIELLVSGLIRNRCITYLDLSCNKIVWDGGASLAKYLGVNQTLKTLILHANRIENPGAESIANALAYQNKTLKKLVVSKNNIASKGLCALAESLQHNFTLTYLYIWGNKLETAACVALSSLLECGRLRLTNVDFIPYVSVDGVVNLASAIVSSNDVQ